MGAGVEGHFAVNIANSASINGPYTLNASWDTPLIRKVNGSSWIENPIVSTLPGGKFATVFDWVQGGGKSYGAPLPYIGFSWSADGITWPEKNGELISVVPNNPKLPHWTDLVRTPTQLVPITTPAAASSATASTTATNATQTYVLFYAGRDTRKATPPYVNCSVPPPAQHTPGGHTAVIHRCCPRRW